MTISGNHSCSVMFNENLKMGNIERQWRKKWEKNWKLLLLGYIQREPELCPLLLLWSLVLEPLHTPDHLAICYLQSKVAIVVISDPRAPGVRSIVCAIEVGTLLVVVRPIMPGMQSFAFAHPHMMAEIPKVCLFSPKPERQRFLWVQLWSKLGQFSSLIHWQLVLQALQRRSSESNLGCLSGDKSS